MYLSKIVDYKRQELEHQKRKVSLKDVRLKAQDAAPARDFLGSLRAPGARIIAEVKKASPSAGVIRLDFKPVDIARSYEDGGAACLSILTDEHFFQGSLKYLQDARVRVKIPCLRKDFTLDEYHIHEARAHDADAVLLIVRILDDVQLKDYRALSEEFGMAALVEVHDAAEMERAKKAGATLIGINNRNLDTFKTDLKTSVTLAKNRTSGTVFVSESGISKPEDIRELRRAGIEAFLIGEAFMREEDPGACLRSFLQATL